jgi:delta-lactam-biosynthetic de-N-acetylase
MTTSQKTNANKKKQQMPSRQIRQRIIIACVSLLLLFGIVLLIHKVSGSNKSKSVLGEATENSDTSSAMTDTSADATETVVTDASTLTVCIAPGHGGKDTGTTNGDRLEKNDTLTLGLALRDYLESQGVQTIMTRETDEFVKLSKQTKIANQSEADFLISLHRNTGTGNGAEAWISKAASDSTVAYAEAIMSGLENVGISRNRGIKYGSQDSANEDYAINRDAKMPSMILELGFINSSTDNDLLDQHLSDYAAAIGDAIIETAQALKAKENPESETETDTSESTSSYTGEGGMDSQGNVTSIHLENETMDENQDGTLIEWGQGKNFDDLNRPGSCVTFQEKYGDQSAYFLGPWEEGDPKVIYLTFDIGYTNEATVSILDTLKEKGVQAVFFATLQVIEDDDDMVKRIIAEGNELGNHSATHPASGIPSESTEEQREEVMKVHNLCLEKYQYEMHLFRFPAGKFSKKSLAIVNNCNYRSVFWSYAYADWDVNSQPDVSTSLAAAVERLHPGAIYLFHGISSTNAAILGDFIDQAREQGYTFELLQ